jgi:outer membrane murein-binding lipoprotein Lpp
MGLRTGTAAAIALASLALAGCNQADKGPKTMEQAQQEAAKLDRPQPGQYSQTMKITKLEIPGAPPEAVAQMKAAMGAQQDTSFCLTKEMSDKGFEEMFREVGRDGECKYERFNVSGGKLDALLQCESKTEGKGTITMAGTVTSQGSDVTVEIDTVNPASPMGSSTIGMNMVSKRIGDCPAPTG